MERPLHETPLWKSQVVHKLISLSNPELQALWSNLRLIDTMLEGSEKSSDWYWFSREVLLACYRRQITEL